MPVTLANRLQTRSERNDGTIMNRDYVVIKTGEGLDTEYDVENGDKYEISGSHSLYDIEDMLEQAFIDGAGMTPEESTTAHKVVPEEEEKAPFSEPPVQSASEDDEDFITEEAVRAMNMVQLLNLMLEEKMSVPPKIKDEKALAEYVISQMTPA